MKKKVLLAFSGGLDTSYCVKYLSKEKDLEVHSAIVNTGGFSIKELEEIEKKAYDLGVKEHYALEETNAYYENIIRFLVFGNVLKNNTYPLSVSAERTHQAIALVQQAKKIKADFIAHGSTGAGNDQVRFDLIFQLLAPELEILTPIRDQQLSRQDEIDYLTSSGIKADFEQNLYSVNKGLWGTSVGGKETLTSDQGLPESAYPAQVIKQKSESIFLQFKQGELVGLNNESLSSVQAIQKLDQLASKFGIGRDVHVGDTIIGIKGRVGFEASAALLIIKAHHHLEKHTLSKWQLQLKEQLSSWYGMFIHEAKYFEPVMRDIESFLENSQKNVSGTVELKLHPYRFEIVGVRSEHDLMNSAFGDYGEMNKTWSTEDVKGFTKIEANALQVFNHVNPLL